MINNEIIESFLNCHYKAYLKSDNKVGNKTEFENLESDLLKINRKQYFDSICSKYGKDQILRNFDFKKKNQIKNKCYYIEPLLIRKQFNIRFDALEVILDKSFPNKISYIPISVSPKENILKTEKLSLSIKYFVLKEFYNFTPEHGRIIYGGDLKSTKIAFKTYEKESRNLLKELTKIINSTDDSPLHFRTHFGLKMNVKINNAHNINK